MHKILALLDWLAPDTCLLCEQVLQPPTATRLCLHCRDALAWNDRCCPHCALPTADNKPCAPCARKPLIRGSCIVPLLYDDLAQLLVHRLKFHKGFREARCLAAIMASTAAARGQPYPAALLPVPLAYVNEVRRGYNQAFELAHHVGRILGIPVRGNALTRRRGPAQRNLGRSERQRLSASAFRVRQPIAADHVAIVDDVLTTGSTVQALASALTDAGVERVDAWCATRAVLS